MKKAFQFPRRTRKDVVDDVRAEFEFHIDMRVHELVQSGLDEAQARRQALREFGDAGAGANGCVSTGARIERRRWLARVIGEARQDVRLGVRLMLRDRWHSAAAILTLAVAIGANTAIFSVANALLFKPLPVRASSELARVRPGESQISWLNYQDLANRSDVFAGTAAHRRLLAGMATDAEPIRLWGEQTTSNYFSLLGVRAASGRAYLPSDSRRDVVVLAHHVWRTRFGADPAVVGRLVTLNGRSFEVLGVMPSDFRGLAPAGLLQDFWSPIDDSAPNGMLSDRRATRFEMFGRLAPGVNHVQAASALQLVAQGIRAEHPELPETFIHVEVFPVDGIGAFRGMADLILPVLAFLTLTSTVAALVLLMGCANIGGILLGRAAARRKEIAVRLALGAGRGRLVRQLLTESLVLAMIGGGAGLLLAFWLTSLVNPLLSGLPAPIEFDLQIDRRVLAYAFAASTAAALIFGLTPARRAARFGLVSSLKDEAAGSAVRQRLRRSLVVAQVAVCTVLLIWSGLFLRSLNAIGSIDPGFNPHGVVLAQITLDDARHDRAFGDRLFQDLEEQVRASPTVAAAAAATVVPLSLENEEFDIIRDASSAPDATTMRQRVWANRLTPGWFATVRIPLIAGRDFTPDDRDGTAPVAIVNATLARQFWGGEGIGKRVRIPGRPERVLEVVGIVADSKYWTLGEEIAPTIYLPFHQAYTQWLTLHVRTSDRRSTIQTISAFMKRRAPDVFVDIAPMEETVGRAVIPARVGAWVTASFGVVAMLLAALGVYGLVSFSVAQRAREMGLRKAIGAGTWDVVRLIVGEHLVLTLTGLAAGAVFGLLGAHVLRTFIAGVSPADPITLITAGILVCVAALAASAVPAVRAALVNPLVVFRDV